MGIQAWMIKSWPAVEWYLPPEPEDWPAMWHINTQVRDYGQEKGRRFGETVWLGTVDGKSIGAAWEWVELRPGVVMLADQNSIISNIRFVAENSAHLEDLHAVISLNRVTHHLPWQEAVGAVLTTMREHPEVAACDQVEMAGARRVIGSSHGATAAAAA